METFVVWGALAFYTSAHFGQNLFSMVEFQS